jgi:hypothetical protein
LPSIPQTPQCSTSPINRAGIIGQIVGDVPNGHSLTPPTWSKVFCFRIWGTALLVWLMRGTYTICCWDALWCYDTYEYIKFRKVSGIKICYGEQTHMQWGDLVSLILLLKNKIQLK